MKVDYFYAQESKTGDYYYGFVFDNSGVYRLGSTYTSGTDQLGGTWKYTFYNVSTADSVFQGASWAGKVYDYLYYDADQGSYFTPYLDSQKIASGTNYLGSDADSIYLNGGYQLFGHSGNSWYVVPESRITTSVQALTSGADILDGSFGNQTLIAGDISAVFIGGPNDVLIGGTADDIFVFGRDSTGLITFGQNTVVDFTIGQDKIALDRTIYADFTGLQQRIAQHGTDTVITIDANDTITLQNVAAFNLHASDFLFV